MYIRLWDQMRMGKGRRMHVCMCISNMRGHFRMATEIWGMYMMMSPMSGNAPLWGPSLNNPLTLQPVKLAVEVHYKLLQPAT